MIPTRTRTQPIRRATAMLAATCLAGALAVSAAPPQAAADSSASITLSRTSDLSPDGEVLTVSGQGFDAVGNLSTRPPVPAGEPAGVYVVFTRVPDVWQPSEGAPSSARTALSQRWAMPQSSYDSVAGSFPNLANQLVVMGADGSFETELTVAPDADREELYPDGTYAVITFAGGGAPADAAAETIVPVNFATSDDGDDADGDGSDGDDDGDGNGSDEDEADEQDTPPPPASTDDEDDDPDAAEQATRFAVVGGTLDWGVRDSFRTYVLGPIAGGSIATSGAASANDDGTFRFAVDDGGYDTEADTLVASSSGTVSFAGHVTGGQALLQFDVSDPRIEIDGDQGVLIVDAVSRSLDSGATVTYDQVTMATLDLSGIEVGDADGGEIRLTGIPTQLTSSGAPAFGGFYSAGDALDPIDVVLEVVATDGTVPSPSPRDPALDEVLDDARVDDEVLDEVTATPTGSTTAPPELPETGAGGTALLALIGLALVAAGTATLRRTAPRPERTLA